MTNEDEDEDDDEAVRRDPAMGDIVTSDEAPVFQWRVIPCDRDTLLIGFLTDVDLHDGRHPGAKGCALMGYDGWCCDGAAVKIGAMIGCDGWCCDVITLMSDAMMGYAVMGEL